MLRPRPVETVVRRVDDDDLDNVRRLLAENQGKRVFLHKRGKVNVKFDQSSPLGQPLSVLSNYPIRSKVRIGITYIQSIILTRYINDYFRFGL